MSQRTEQRVVCVNVRRAESWLMAGDPELGKYIEGDGRDGKGAALPRLLAEGWHVNRIESTGDGTAIVVIDRGRSA